MTLAEQIADFAAFARNLVEQQGGDLTLDDAYQKWKAIESNEIDLIQDRLASYDEGEHGRPVADFLAEFRDTRAKGKA